MQACRQSIELVRDFEPAAFADQTVPVVDYTCQPGARGCEAGFSVLVVLAQPGWTDPSELPAYEVVGIQEPQQAAVYVGDSLPEHVVELLPQ